MSISGQRSGKASDRTSFVNLVSQYIKERRSLGDVKGPEMSKAPALTMDFLINMANPTESSRPNTASALDVKSSDLSPQAAPAGASVSKENTASQTDSRGPPSVEARTAAQMTIFYKGQVLVYNDCPGDRAKEILAMASQGCSSTGTGSFVETVMDHKTNPSTDKVVPTSPNIPDLNVASASGSKPTEENPAGNRPQVISSDLPIARRNSLHKFLEKRKDRAAARAPYQVHNPHQSPPLKKDGGCFLPEKGQSSGQAYRDLDLNL